MPMVADSVRQLAASLTVAAIVVAALVLGQPILIPLAGAAIIAFVLAPIVRWICARGAPRGLSVALVTVVVVVVAIAVTTLLSVQLLTIASRMGDYRENILQKVRTVSVIGRDDGAIKRAADAFDRLSEAVGRELERPASNAEPTANAGIPVVVKEAEPKSTVAVKRLAEIGEPLARLALLVLFTLFLLLQHQDMRDRLIRVFGTENLSETTSAMSEAGKRLSRLFLAQAVLSAAFGLLTGLVLWFAGLPGAVVWAVLAGLMRFVPFIGPYVAAAPPIIIAAGMDPGWGLAMFTAVYFVVSEIVMGNFIEPMILGRRVGLSPFAMIAAASFWTLVWGPVGLLLAAPLTMALVVIGRYIPGLAFISVLLGDEPALTPAQELYHRLLSRDVYSAAEQLETTVERDGMPAIGDDLVLPALRLAASDARHGRLSDVQAAAIRETLEGASELVAEFSADTPTAGDKDRATTLVIPARGDVDITTARFLARLITAHTGREAKSTVHATGLTAITAVEGAGASAPDTIAIVTSGDVPAKHLQLIAARAHRVHPSARIFLLADSRDLQDSKGSAGRIEGEAVVVPSAAELLANLNPTLTSRDASQLEVAS